MVRQTLLRETIMICIRIAAMEFSRGGERLGSTFKHDKESVNSEPKWDEEEAVSGW